MEFYFDESGDFRIPKDENEHRVSVVMGVVIPEFIKEELYEEFNKFVSELDSSECENGEPKGSLFTNKHKFEFCELLLKFEGIQLTPVTLDLTPLLDVGYTNFNKHMADILNYNA